MAMTDQHRAGADQIVDIFIAAHVPNATAFAAADDDAGAFVAETARRQNLRRGFVQFAFFFADISFDHDFSPSFGSERV